MTLTPISTTPAPRSWGEWFPLAARAQLLMVGTLFAVVFGETIRRRLVYVWQHDGNWSHGWIIPLLSLYFVGMRRRELFRAAVKPSYVGAAILAGSLALYLATFYYTFGYVRGLSAIGAVFGMALLFGGWQVLRLVWFPICYLLLAVPIPAGMYVAVTFPLRRIASLLAGSLLDLLPSVHIETQNVVIDFINENSGLIGHLNVAEACSGMRLIMAFVAIGLAVAYLMVGPAWQRIGVVLSCIPIAIFCNMVRVTVTGMLYIYGREELARGTPHQLLGIAMLPLALGLFSLVRYALGHLWIEDDRDKR